MQQERFSYLVDSQRTLMKQRNGMKPLDLSAKGQPME